jgi:hypothetical protein
MNNPSILLLPSLFLKIVAVMWQENLGTEAVTGTMVKQIWLAPEQA